MIVVGLWGGYNDGDGVNSGVGDCIYLVILIKKGIVFVN